jgi:hypothetical protein
VSSTAKRADGSSVPRPQLQGAVTVPDLRNGSDWSNLQ